MRCFKAINKRIQGQKLWICGWNEQLDLFLRNSQTFFNLRRDLWQPQISFILPIPWHCDRASQISSFTCFLWAQKCEATPLFLRTENLIEFFLFSCRLPNFKQNQSGPIINTLCNSKTNNFHVLQFNLFIFLHKQMKWFQVKCHPKYSETQLSIFKNLL